MKVLHNDKMGLYSSKPLKEVLRENKRMINRAVRELDREKSGLEREEKRLMIEIKKAAKENQMASVKVMAKVRKSRRRHFHCFFTKLCTRTDTRLNFCFSWLVVVLSCAFCENTLTGSSTDTAIYYQIH